MFALRWTVRLGLPASLIAMSACWLVWPPLPASPGTPSPQAGKINPDLADISSREPLLVSRVTARFPHIAVDVARQCGLGGLVALDRFGAPAAALFEESPAGFAALASVDDLDPELFAAITGPWRVQAVEWARSGDLPRFIDSLKGLSNRDRRIFREVPAALPVLLVEAPVAREMLERHGKRAWHLFALIDCTDEDSLERVASALKRRGRRMLALNEEFGLGAALLFVPPTADKDDALPGLFEYLLERFPTAGEAVAILQSNYDDIQRLVIEEKQSEEDLHRAVQLLAAQPEAVRQFAADSGYTLRLAGERDGDSPVGIEALACGGPRVADLLYQAGGPRYASRADDRRAALSLVRRFGWQAVRLLGDLGKWDPWRKLLRREDLRGPASSPLLFRAVHRVAKSADPQTEVERLMKMPAEQIAGLDEPPSTTDLVLEWVPGYTAFRATARAAAGFHQDNDEVMWAVVDGVSTVTLVYGLVGQTVKTVGKQATRKAAEVALQQAEKKAAQEVAKAGFRAALARLPGSMYAFVRSLPATIPKADVTEIARLASAVARKVGIRTWGKLDRRIIMRGDRKVVIDLMNPQFMQEVRREAARQLGEGLLGVARKQGEAALRLSVEDQPLAVRLVAQAGWKKVQDGVGELAACAVEQVWSRKPKGRGK